ncbi:MAG: GspE/PulE family protein [Hyphomicrobium aestuarii]|nr:GspE/PulE family protein [Hyphomicrobium aestuarii]
MRAERAASETGERLDRVLTRLGLIGEADLTRLTATFLGRRSLSAADFPSTPLAVDRLDADYLQQTRMVPVDETPEMLVVAVADPFKPDLERALSFLLDRPVQIAVATERDIERALERLYLRAPSTTGAEQMTERPASLPGEARADDVRRLAELASEAPIIRRVQDIIVRAVEERASDIHLEPSEQGLTIRRRVDGLLELVDIVPERDSPPVVSRIKIMANLDIAERRLPQDGRIRVVVGGREVDLRVATMPTLDGESIVLRILDRGNIALDFAALGFRGPALTTFLGLLDQPNGLILVTGPTGSGKSTTLYTALTRLAQPSRKTFSIEDPVEYRLSGVAQVQVQPRIGLTFAHALRSVLRQDPDVIMVGEIRDLETAEMAIQSALTGHLVLSTLHTNSAAATIARLIDMGVDDYLVASTLKATLAQRLVRQLCLCSVPTPPNGILTACLADAKANFGVAQIDMSLDRLRRPVGCPACRNTGFRGRLAISQLMPVTPSVAAAIVDRAHGRPVEAAAASTGMPDMLADGLAKVLDGETTLDEVLRVTRTD